MADERAEASLHPSGSATPKGKLESLTKEDLIKFIKRQANILQKIKSRNSELETQISGAEKETLSETSKDDVEKEAQMSSLEDQCKLLRQEKEAVFDKYVTFEKKNKNLIEEVECLSLKNETLTSTFFCLQQEQATLLENNKKLIAEKSDLQIKLEDLVEETFAWKAEKESLVTEMARSKPAVEENEFLRIENIDLQSKLVASEKEKDEIMNKLENLKFKNEQRSEQIILLQSEINRLQDCEQQEINLRQKLKEVEELVQKYETKSGSQSMENVQNQENIKSLLIEIDQLKNSAHTIQTEFEMKQNILQAEIEKFTQETEQLKNSYSNVQCELENVISEKCELQRKNEEMINEIEQLKVNFDSEKLVSFQNEARKGANSDPGLNGYTLAGIEKLEMDLETETSEKVKLLEKIVLLERNVEDERKEGAMVLSGKLEEINKLMRELENANCKLLDYDTNLGHEFSVEVIQNLQQELAETKMKLAELEGSGEMYAREDHGAEEEPRNMQQSGWLDLPDIQEESESDQGQQEQSSRVDEDELAKGDIERAPQPDPDDHICVERIEKFIAVSSHVLAGDSYDRGDASEVLMLKTRISELEQENEALKSKFESEKKMEKGNEKRDDTEMDKHSEIIADLQAHRQHLEEKLVILGDKHETVTFELEELHAERESLKSEMECLQNQLGEWESIMGMLKEEKDCLAHELEHYSHKDASLRKELEFLLSSLNEAITERDTLQDEVFKLSQHEDSAQGDVQEMKSMIEGIIAERNSLLSELDTVLTAKADSTITIEGLKREIQELRTEKDDVEREKESLLIRFHLAEDKESSLSESYETQMKLSSEIEENLQGLQQQTEAYKYEIASLKQVLDVANEKLKTAEDFAAERNNYSLDLENQILELSNLLADAKKDFSNLKDQFDRIKAESATTSGYCQQIEVMQNQGISYMQSQEIPFGQILELSNLLADAKKDFSNLKDQFDRIKAESATTSGYCQQIEVMQNQGISDMQSQEIADIQNQGIADIQNHEIADMQSQGIADIQSQAIADMQSQGIADMQNQGITDMQSQGKADMQSQGIADIQNQGISDMQNQEITDMQNQEITDTQKQKQADLDLQNQEKADLQDQVITDLQSQKDKYQQSIEHLTSAVNELREERDELSQNANHAFQEVDNLKKELSAIVNEKAELDQLVIDLKTANENVEGTMLSLQRNCESLSSDRCEIEQQFNLSQEQLKELESKKISLEEELQIKIDASSLLEDCVEQLKLKEKELCDALKDADEKLAVADGEKVGLKSSMEELIASVRMLQDQKNELEKQISYWTSSFEALQTQTEEKQVESDRFQQKVDKIEHELSSLKDLGESADTQNSDLLHRLHQKQEEIVHMMTEINKEFSEKETSVDKTDEDDRFERIVKKSNKVCTNLTNDKWRCDKLAQLIVDLKQSFQQQGLIKVAEESIFTLTRERDSAIQKFTEEQNRMREFEECLRLKKDEVLDMKTEIAAVKLEKENLIHEIEEIRTNFSSVVAETSKMEEKCKNMERKSIEFEHSLLEKETEIIRYREQIAGLATIADSHGSVAEENFKLKLDLERRVQGIAAENETLKSQLDKTDSLLKPLQENVELLELELNKIRKEKDESILEMDNLRIQNNDHISMRMKNEEEVCDLKEKVSNFIETIDSLTSQITQIRVENDELCSRIEQSEKNVELLKNDLRAAREEGDASAESFEQEKEKLQSELAVLTNEKEDLLSKLRSSEEQVGNMKRQLSELNESLNNSRSQTEDKETRLTAMEIELRDKEEGNIQRSSQENIELASLRKQLKEKEDINSKLKQLAIKTKKELGDKQAKLEAATKQLNQVTKAKETLELMNETLHKESEGSTDSLSQQLKNLQENYKKVQASFDAVQDEAEQEKKALKTAQKDIEQLVAQLTEVKGQAAAHKEEKEQLLKQVDLLRAQIKSKESLTEELKTKLRVTDTEMAAVRIQMEELNKDRQKVEQRLLESDTRLKLAEDEHNAQITKLEASLKASQEHLTAAWQSVKQNSMLDLEMADYERTISSLHAKVAERDQKIEEIKAEIDKQEQTITFLKVQIDTVEEQRSSADDRANKLKALLVKTKKDLSDARKLESAQRSSDASLRGKLENTSQQVEDFKVQVSQVMADNQRLQEKLRSQNDSSQRTVKSLEARVESLTNELQVTKNELKVIRADYDSYKVRAHNVLRQQKSKTTADESTDAEKHEKERYENAIDHLKGKLHEAQSQLQAARKDAELLQEEHDHLIQRHTKLITDLEEREASFRLRLENVTKEKSEALTELQEKIASLETQKAFQNQKFQEKISKLKDENAEVIDVHQKQLDASEMDNIRLQREIQQLQRLLRTREDSVEHTSPSEFYPITIHPVEERQEGEGSEIVDPEPTKNAKAHTQATTFTFERLIATPLEELPVVKSSAWPTVDEEGLKSTIAASQKKIEHLTELLSESEESVSRLTEQARILKDEIRRLERNMERERETQNMEYLKNIFLQFVCPKVGEQKVQLVPVLTTMLKLSPEEKARIQAVAQGDDQASQGGQGGLGWSSYLHRWSSLT